MPGDGPRLDWCATEEDAARLLNGALAEVAEGKTIEAEGFTLEVFGKKWLDARETAGLRSVDDDRSRWRCHIATAPFVSWPLKAITRGVLRDWIDALVKKRVTKGNGHKAAAPRKLSRTTIQNTVNVLRGCLDAAVEREYIDENPAKDLALPRTQGRTHDPWTYLVPDEQLALLKCEAIPRAERLIVAFAIGTGVRENEQWLLELRDVHAGDDVPDPHVWIRYGSIKRGKKLPPKNGRIRKVPLFGLALEAARTWIAELPAYLTNANGKRYTNDRGLMFPTRRGLRRPTGKPAGGQYYVRTAELAVGRARWRAEARASAGTFFWCDDVLTSKRKAPRDVVVRLESALTKAEPGVRYRWADWLQAAGLVAEARHDTRPVRWHDLRHTCASSLVAGWWGRRWSLEEVRKILGHSSVIVTERYAHLADSALADAARSTTVHALIAPVVTPRVTPGSGAANHVNVENHGAPPAEIESAANGLGNRSISEVKPETKRDDGAIVALAEEGLQAIQEGGAFAWARATAALAQLRSLALSGNAEPTKAAPPARAKIGRR